MELLRVVGHDWAKLSFRPYRSIRQAAVGRETAERRKSVLKSC
jgi:hypothetical protein